MVCTINYLLLDMWQFVPSIFEFHKLFCNEISILVKLKSFTIFLNITYDINVKHKKYKPALIKLNKPG